MRVPLLDLKPQYNQLRSEIKEVINNLLEAQTFILGKPVEDLEKSIAEYSGAEFGVGTASGSDALFLALEALGVGQGDEVITTPYTFFATAGAISRVGATPVFADIDPNSYNIDPALIEAAITPRSKAVIPVHLYGQCADMDAITQIARQSDLPVIEDAAQAIGAEYKGRRAGSMGTLGCFSFFPTKNLGGIGDGGMIVTDRKDLAEKIKLLRVHGSGGSYYHKIIGVNSRLDAIQAAVVRVKLKYLPEWTEKRRLNARLYRQLFQDADLIDTLGLPVEGEANKHIYNQFVIRTDQRDALREFLIKAQIGNNIYYPLPLHLQECYSYLGHKKGDYPESELAAKETLALPIYPELTPQMQEYVVEKIGEFFGKRF